jgi:hypothetical protein
VKNFSFTRTALALTAFCAATGVASATSIFLQQLGPTFSPSSVTVTEPFPTAGDAYTSATNGNGTIPVGGQTAFQYTAGDSVTSSIFLLGGPSVVGLTANWTFQDFLGGGGSETWYVLVNGTLVAQATLPDCSYCGTDFAVTGSVSFADIFPLAGGYQIQLVLQNTVGNGLGSVAWLDGGTTGLDNTTPEPASLLLVGSGMLAFAGILRRKRA